jgi:hypothetical protein
MSAFHERKNLKHFLSSGHKILEYREFVANSLRLMERGGDEKMISARTSHQRRPHRNKVSVSFVLETQ